MINYDDSRDMLMKPGGMNEMCVPSSSLSIEGEEPKEGDKVSFTVDGTVARNEGGQVYVTPSMVNGEPVKEAAAPAPTDEEADEAMREMAMKEDRSAGFDMENY